MKKFLAGAFLAAAFALPIVASADTQTVLQTQLIQVLTQLVQLLEAQLAALQGGQPQTQPQPQTQTQTQPQIDMCPPAPVVPTNVTCSAQWNKINDSNGCHVGWSCIVYSTTVAGKTVQPPIISAVQGPTDLLVNTSGTWKVTATSPVQQRLSYSVIWGDEGPNVSQLLDFAAQGTGNYSTINSFSHTYSTQGSYNLIFFVKDEDGNINKATMSVFVQPPPPPPPPPAPAAPPATSCLVGGTPYAEGTRLDSATLFLRGSGHSTYTLDPHRAICMYVQDWHITVPSLPAPYYYTCRAGHWYNDNGGEYCAMLVPPSLLWRYKFFVDVVPDFCGAAAAPGASCTINGQQYQEGQSYYFGCAVTGCPIGLIFPPGGPGWRVCHNGSWTTSGGNDHNCSPGYGWCPAGAAGYSCALLTGGTCPLVL